jgi:hypothetical protein
LELGSGTGGGRFLGALAIDAVLLLLAATNLFLPSRSITVGLDKVFVEFVVEEALSFSWLSLLGWLDKIN